MTALNSHPTKVRIPFSVSHATPADCAAITTIYNQAIAKGGITMDGEPKSVMDWQRCLQNLGQRERLLVGRINQAVIGWGIVKRYSERSGYQGCCETSVYLHLSRTGQGYGKVIQTELLQQASHLGYHHIVAKVVTSNPGSIHFHKKLGFELVGIQKNIGYLAGKWHDVAILQYLFSHAHKKTS